MKRALIRFAVGAATTVVLVVAQIAAWAVHTDFYDDDVWADQ